MKRIHSFLFFFVVVDVTSWVFRKKTSVLQFSGKVPLFVGIFPQPNSLRPWLWCAQVRHIWDQDLSLGWFWVSRPRWVCANVGGGRIAKAKASLLYMIRSFRRGGLSPTPNGKFGVCGFPPLPSTHRHTLTTILVVPLRPHIFYSHVITSHTHGSR